MTNQTPSYALELAWKALLTPFAISAGILPSNIFLTEANTQTLHPCLKIITQSCEEDPGIGTGFGVWVAEILIAYETKLSADQQSASSANASFEQILQGIYYGSSTPNQFLLPYLASRLNSAGIANFYVYGFRRGIRIQNTVQISDKLWRKEIRLVVVFLNRASP